MKKKAKRIHETEKVVKKRMKLAKQVHNGRFITEPGRCRKQSPCDCGHTKCFCCHSDKLDKIPTKQDIVSSQDLKDAE